ncbi:hypothetical protein PENFLA_c054G05449 [Penicillium flavigenum]|uniref:Reverse transcriptase domain-containing protein n=1 Tax=Penicillium flavigenum TaxID=254877 RepID=A0A1V6SGE8_9EURO|nr:hypothetical protein PENFLA_c054G05449 [Penicillium flavigenum]
MNNLRLFKSPSTTGRLSSFNLNWLTSSNVSCWKGKSFVTIIDAAKFFYQWRVHPDNVDLQSVVTHRGQEFLKVVVTGNESSMAYVQRQIDLRDFREWCRAYVDDIVVVADTLKQHVIRLRLVFAKLEEHNMSRSLACCFLCRGSGFTFTFACDSLASLWYHRGH